MHEGEAKLHLHCQRCSVLCTVTFIAKHFSPGASSGDINRTPGSGLSVKRGYTLSSCCCVYLISLLFPALPFQICYAFRSPFLSPVMFYCFCFSSYVQITFISPLLAIYLQKRHIQLPPPSTEFMEHCCLPYEGGFFCFSDFSFQAPFPIFPAAGFLLHIFHLCFHFPLNRLTCCVPGSLWTVFSIHYSLFCHLFW